MQVDLHIHSTASDGTWTPPEVVTAALAAGLGAIAVTDHDSVANVASTHELAIAAGLKFIPGAEICSTKDDFCFHILGYGIDVTNKRLLDLLEHNERLLNSKDDESIKMLIERGWPLDFEEFLRYDYDRRRGGWKALAFLQDKGLCGDVNDFFSRIFTNLKVTKLLVSAALLKISVWAAVLVPAKWKCTMTANRISVNANVSAAVPACGSVRMVRRSSKIKKRISIWINVLAADVVSVPVRWTR